MHSKINDGNIMTEKHTTGTKDVDICKNCKYSEKTRITGHAGLELMLCKRYPPVIIHGETGMQIEYSAWPTVPFNAWCGEFSWPKT